VRPDSADVELRGERVRLRRVRDDDIAELTAKVNAPEVARWWGSYTEQEMRAEVNDPGITACWTVEVDGQVGGLVEVTEDNEPDYRNVALDLFIAAPLHGRGLGADALRAILRHMFEQRGHHRATIDPAVENERAIRSYARVGFRPVGVLRRAERGPDGHWRDALLMDLLAEELR